MLLSVIPTFPESILYIFDVYVSVAGFGGRRSVQLFDYL